MKNRTILLVALLTISGCSSAKKLYFSKEITPTSSIETAKGILLEKIEGDEENTLRTTLFKTFKEETKNKIYLDDSLNRLLKERIRSDRNTELDKNIHYRLGGNVSFEMVNGQCGTETRCSLLTIKPNLHITNIHSGEILAVLDREYSSNLNQYHYNIHEELPSSEFKKLMYESSLELVNKVRKHKVLFSINYYDFDDNYSEVSRGRYASARKKILSNIKETKKQNDYEKESKLYYNLALLSYLENDKIIAKKFLASSKKIENFNDQITLNRLINNLK